VGAQETAAVVRGRLEMFFVAVVNVAASSEAWPWTSSVVAPVLASSVSNWSRRQ
jgi:mannose/fructose/N-acetylgalactosamine-specific phosphotransferase system component IIC